MNSPFHRRPVARAPREPDLKLLLQIHFLQLGRRVAAIRRQSRLLTGLTGLFVVGYIALSFFLFQKGVKFMSSFPGLGDLLIERLMMLLFAFLFLMLLFSSLVVGYTNLFRNRETHYLLTLPISRQTVFRWKFVESTIVASWAFLFLVAPLLAAFGLTQEVPWHYYLITPVLIAVFIVLPAALGAWSAVYLARYLDRKQFQIGLVAAVALLAGACLVWFRPETVTDQMLETRVLLAMDKLLAKTEFSQFPFLPSYWLSSGVLRWAEGALESALFFALVLLSYSLLFGFLTVTRLDQRFYEAASAVQSRGGVMTAWRWFGSRRANDRLEPKPGHLEKLLRGLWWLQQYLRALVIKDMRLFWRDTAQWGQTLMLFGLLAVYIVNLRHFSHQLTHPFWVHLVSYLNLGACSLNLATLTTRFVYPQFSLEGKRVWIVGLAPLGLTQVVRVKYWLASGTTLLITLGLMGLSCYMLRMSAERTAYFLLAVALMTFSLNGLAVGLGALYPNFKEDNPSKIVSGFGGTFCLVLSFLYIVASVVLLAFGSPWAPRTTPSVFWFVLCWGGFGLLSFLLGRWPYRLALKQVARFEL